MEENSKKSQELVQYILDQLVKDVNELKDDIHGSEALIAKVVVIESNYKKIQELSKRTNELEDRISTLEREDKKSRVRIVILLIVLIFTYLTASVPRIISLIEALEKFL